MEKQKRCKRCGKLKSILEFYSHKLSVDKLRYNCKSCLKDVGREYYIKNRNRFLEYQKSYRKDNPEKVKLFRRKKNLKIKLKVLIHYGGNPPRCACCGEGIIQFLSIDHINEDGTKHRKKFIGKLSYWIVKNNFPKGYQILCFNCNCAKGFFGYCPHKSKDKIDDKIISELKEGLKINKP